MKHFIYFDDRLLASFYAQAFGGLTTQKQLIAGDSTSSTTTDGTIHLGSTIEGKANFVVASAAGNISADVNSPTASFTENELAQELVTSTMHDNIFDKVMEHANNNALINNETPTINQYMNIMIPLRLSNLHPLTQKLDSETFRYSMKEILSKSAFNAMEPSNPNMAQAKWDSEKRKVADKLAQDQVDELKKSIKQIQGLMEIVPLNTYVYGQHDHRQVIIPTQEKYFREPLDYVTTFMSGDVVVFGRVSKFGIETHFEGKLGSLNDGLNQIVEQLISDLCGQALDENTVILYPLAIYFQ